MYPTKSPGEAVIRRRYLQQKWTPAKIARRYRTAVSSVCDWLIKYQIPRRRNRERPSLGYLDFYGYRIIRVNGKPKREHRHVMEQALGRRLRRNEHVHHLNGVKDDNRRKNLSVMSAKNHAKTTGASRAYAILRARCFRLAKENTSLRILVRSLKNKLTKCKSRIN